MQRRLVPGFLVLWQRPKGQGLTTLVGQVLIFVSIVPFRCTYIRLDVVCNGR